MLEYLAVRKLNPDVKGPILCFLGPPGVGQDVARQVDRQLARPQVRARVARRHARRGRDPRSSAHLHRRAAGPGHPGAAPRRIEEPRLHPRRDRQARLGFPRRPGVSPARGARPGAEQHVPRSLSRRAVRSLGGPLPDDRQRARPGAAAAARSHGGARARGLHRGREAQDCRRAPDRQADHQPRADRRAAGFHRSGDPGRHSRLHARGRRQESRARDRRALPQGRATPCRGRRDQGHDHARARRRDARGADLSRRGNREPHQGSRRGRRPRLDARRRRSPLHRSITDAGRRQPHADRPARRRDEGVRPDSALVVPLAREPLRRRPARSTRIRRFTCTSRPARSPRTARRPASRW